jgi:nicotinamidase-related amidase
MTLTSLNKAALIVLDLQVATAALPTTPHSAAEIVERSARLASAFRDGGRPVIWVSVNGGVSGRIENKQEMPDLPDNWAELLPELGVVPDDHRFAKQAWGAFHDGRMEVLLADLGVEQVVLTGVTTSFAVESTARAAFERNYNVVIVTDAIGDLDAAAHESSVTRIFPNLGELATADEVTALLSNDQAQ